MTFVYGSTTHAIVDAHIREIQTLSRRLFGDYFDTEGDWRFKQMPSFTVFEARSEGTLVGFKIGYAHTRTRYYSWLGGVDPNLRRKGIARELMVNQHHWLIENGYLSVETGARQSNTAMAKLNLVSGFKVVGIRFKGDDPDILYEKILVSE